MKTAAALKRVVLGRPMASGELEHTLLPKTIALPVFSSDALSSVAYATQEIMLVLGTVSLAAVANVVPISFAVATLLTLVIISYRQTVRAYPNGGGAYIVSHENLGKWPGLLAAAALLIDYVLTVSVSITAGTDAMTTAVPSLDDQSVIIATVFIAFVAMMNLRGVKESGVFFAIPTYGFIISMGVLLLTGFVRCLGECPQADNPGAHLESTEMLTAFLILKAFSAGTTALTGVEAISNGVPAFRYPQSRNAATTLTIMGCISISMFLGVSWLANQMGVIHSHGSERTVLGEIAHAAFGGGIGFYVVQVMTALILILAANTAFADFPRLASILAVDRFMPRQLMNRGDRLVFSNGIVILSLFAALLIIVFDADLNRLIQLYLVGVFASFTLSQAGMVVHWKRFREKNWRRSLFINAFGACLTFTVLGVVIATKFVEGAWIVITATPVLMFLMHSIHKHYMDVRSQLTSPERLPVDRRPGDHHAVIYARKVDDATARAIGYVRSVRAESMTAVTLDPNLQGAWRRLAPDVPLTILQRKGSDADTIKEHLRSVAAGTSDEDFVTLVLPEILEGKGLGEIVRRPGLHTLKASLLKEPRIQVLDVPLQKHGYDKSVDQAQEPARNYVLVLVAGVHNAALQAVEYAETLRPTDIRAVSFGLDPEESEKLGDAWIRAGIRHALEIEASPFRDIGQSLDHYIQQFQPDGTNRVVTVVIPEFIVKKRRHQLLHNQSALIVKRRLLFENGVVVASVPFQL